MSYYQGNDLVNNDPVKKVIIVTKSKVIDKKTNKETFCKYSDVPKDDDGWVYDLTYMPIPYDLMHVKLKDSKAIKSAWWTEKRWRGLRIDTHDTVIAWKRNHDFD